MDANKPCNDLLKPPAAVRDMRKLDQDAFTKKINVPVITTQEQINISQIIEPIKKYLLKLECFRPIVNNCSAEDKTSIMHLDPRKVHCFNDIALVDREVLQSKGISELNFAFKELELQFKNYSVEDIFRAVLPMDKEGMASFTKIGHIIHVNLREHLLPYQEIIGEVLLSKISSCKTVVNKIDSIDNTYRNFKMEVLAGEEDFMVTLKENKCLFEFDFSKVYWNSRLCTEHERLVEMIQRDNVLFDVFAGVGPFSIPSAKKGALVLANDLNPESFKWLQHNAKKNKIGANIKMFNKDGKDFILEEVRPELIKHLKNGKTIHIAMNLPALASEFLKYFERLYTTEELDQIEDFKAPTIYLYCFAKGEETEQITRKLINNCMGRDMTKFIQELFKVRTVSNFKEMMRVKISLTKEILTGNYEDIITNLKEVEELRKRPSSPISPQEEAKRCCYNQDGNVTDKL